MVFGSTWQKIQAELRPGISIRNWTAKNGYLDNNFTVTVISPTRIEICAPSAQYPQVIPARDFEAVDTMWERYCAGSIQRQEIRDVTRFSKYIISILHHIGLDEHA